MIQIDSAQPSFEFTLHNLLHLFMHNSIKCLNARFTEAVVSRSKVYLSLNSSRIERPPKSKCLRSQLANTINDRFQTCLGRSPCSSVQHDVSDFKVPQR
jgi:hypothetical protein